VEIPSLVKEKISKTEYRWLITGVSGFIGSNLLEALLSLNQKVIGLDNFSTGKKENLEDVKSSLEPSLWKNFTFIEGDIRDSAVCKKACEQADVALHQAALGSVPRSIKNPLETNDVNVGGFLRILVAAQEAKLRKFVYASSSSVYGDNADLPKVEEKMGKPLSPYAASKLMNEIYAGVFSALHNMTCIGLRYFNVFGPRQAPDGPYAAVIPRWISALSMGEQCIIYGDGETSRDFCYIENVVSANLLAALSDGSKTQNNCVLNVANHDTTSLKSLYNIIREEVAIKNPKHSSIEPEFKEFRPGDIRHSLADITKAEKLIGYTPFVSVKPGIKKTVEWFLK
jgi:UDP-N-acetylglucosamine 4-epimerase